MQRFLFSLTSRTTTRPIALRINKASSKMFSAKMNEHKPIKPVPSNNQEKKPHLEPAKKPTPEEIKAKLEEALKKQQDDFKTFSVI